MVTIIATKPELAVMRALDKLIGRENYIFQSKMLGGRSVKGGTVADFQISHLGIIISVIGEYWHYNRPDTLARDRLQQIALETSGWRVIYIDAKDAIRNASWYVSEALRGISHSRFGSI